MDLQHYLKELEELVNIDSGTLIREGVTKVAEFMAEKYRSIGWQTELKDLGPEVGKGVFATNAPGAETYDVVLVGHMDTVFPAGTVAERPFRIEGNIAYGPGVADMKNGCLSMFYAMKELAPEAAKRLSIAICLNPDEETGSNNSKSWIDAIAKKSRYAMICESSRNEEGLLVKARKGMGRVHFEFQGLASHAGNAPEAGRSAIHEMAHCIVALTGLADKAKGTTINVGLVSGGDAANIVADKARAVLDVRFWDNNDWTRVEKAIREMISKSFTPDIKISMEVAAHLPAMFPSPETETFMKLVEKAGEEIDIKILWAEVGGGSDGNHIAILGTPVLDGFGPTGGYFHTPKEFLNIDSIIPRTNLIRRVVESL